jgi:hypothetical protein
VSAIRPLQEDDLPQVAGLCEQVLRSGSRTPSGQLVAYFERLVNHPWADPEIPSLVYVGAKGDIVGFIGSYVRRMRFDGRPIRVGLCGQLMSAPEVRNRGVGALLLRRYLAGPQDMTMTTAAAETTRIWKALGGRTSFVRSVNWVRMFRLSFMAGYALKHSGMGGVSPVVRPLASAAQLVTDRLPAISLRPPQPATRAEELTPADVVEHLLDVSSQRRVRPDYDEAFLKWMFHELTEVRSRGDLVKRLVQDRNGRVLGWYVSYFRPGDISHVVQVAAKDGDVQAVLDHLLYDAHRHGVGLLTGQLEPELFEPVMQRRCFLHPVVNFLVQARDPELLNTMLVGDAMISGMEGEWWMGYEVEPFTT